MTPEFQYSEQPAIQLFQKLGYHYYNASETPDPRESLNHVLLKDRLKAAIQRINPWLDENNLKKAVRKITAVPGTSLMEINRKIYQLLQGPSFSVKQVINGRNTDKPVHYIDYTHIDNNDFLVVNQMRFTGATGTSIPDLVVFVNGLPIAVLECKSPKIKNAASDAIDDLNHYQRNSPRLFHYNQICAGIFKVGGKYGAIHSEEIHYNLYKTETPEPVAHLLGGDPTPQDILIYHLFKKESLLDLVRNFVIFETDEGKIIKKLPRYPQVRAVNKALHKLKTTDKGGVIWHTQGSGKSISMVYLAVKLRRDETGFNHPTIIVMTDRKDLDDQITRTFQNCKFPNPIQAGSIRGLGQLIRDSYGKTIMTTIQKFQETGDDGNPLEPPRKVPGKKGHTVTVKRIIDDLHGLVKVTTTKDREGKVIKEEREPIEVPELSRKENVFVFVDEAHRSHYGFLAGFMRKELPNAKFIAFTGTPIDKENKSTLAEFYGGRYLDTYTIKQSVEDGATLPIYYDARLTEHHLPKELIDRQFNRQFGGLGSQKQERLRRKAAGIGTYLNARQRIHEVAKDIIAHYSEKIRPDGFKAMVVCHSREAAASYKEAFDEHLLNGLHSFKTQVIMSIDKKKDADRLKHTAIPAHRQKTAIEDFKLPFGDEDQKTKGDKKQFNNTAITIVCDMLLTGYDVPVVQVMYLDKLLTEHNLLQAIARVNRTRITKSAGFVIDYCGVTTHLSRALEMFADDLKPHEVMEKSEAEVTRLANRHRQLLAFFNGVSVDRIKERSHYIDKAVLSLEPSDVRDQFKFLLKRFNQSVNILLPSPEALKYEYDFKLYNEIKLQAANMYVDESLRITKEESRKVQTLIDTHLHTTGIRYLLEKPISIIDRKKFDEEIRSAYSPRTGGFKRLNRIRHTTKDNMEKNPEFYRPLHKRLEELLELYKANRIQQVELFKELDEIETSIVRQHQEIRALGFSNDAQFAVYKTLDVHLDGDAQAITKTIFQSISGELEIDNWQYKAQVQKTMRLKIKEAVQNSVEKNKKDKIAHEVISLIKNNPWPPGRGNL